VKERKGRMDVCGTGAPPDEVVLDSHALDATKMSLAEAEALEEVIARQQTTIEGRVFAVIKSGQRAHLQYFLKKYPDRAGETNPTDGSTALMWAIRRNDIIMTKLLLEKGASVSVPDKSGSTAFMIACAQQNYDIACELAKYGANPHEVHPVLNASVFDTPLIHIPDHQKERIIKAYHSRTFPGQVFCGLI